MHVDNADYLELRLQMVMRFTAALIDPTTDYGNSALGEENRMQVVREAHAFADMVMESHGIDNETGDD